MQNIGDIVILVLNGFFIWVAFGVVYDIIERR